MIKGTRASLSAVTDCEVDGEMKELSGARGADTQLTERERKTNHINSSPDSR